MYRSRLLPCCQCSSPMREDSIQTASAERRKVNICNTCNGVYFDYFDGEPGELARALLPTIEEVASRGSPPVREPVCPHCEREMTLLPYLEDGALYAEYDSDRPIDAMGNSRVTSTSVPVYVCPAMSTSC